MRVPDGNDSLTGARIAEVPVHLGDGKGTIASADCSVFMTMSVFMMMTEILMLSGSSLEALRHRGVAPGQLRTFATQMARRVEQRCPRCGTQNSCGELCARDRTLRIAIVRLLHALARELEQDGDRSPCAPIRAGHRGVRLRAALGAAIVAFGGLSPTMSFAMDTHDPFSGLQVVDADELSQHRGGFSVNGVDVNFGAMVTTFVNGVVILETQFTATEQGMTVSQSGPATESSTPVVGAPELQVTVVNGSSQAAGSLVPSTFNTSGVNGPKGVVISAPSGASAALSMINTMGVANVVVSNASNQSIAQQVEVNITLNNFSSIGQQIRLSQLGSQVANSVQDALATSIVH